MKSISALAFGVLLAGSAFATTTTLAPGASTGAAGSGTVQSNGSTFPGTVNCSSSVTVSCEAYDSGVVNLTPGVGSKVTATGEALVYRTSGGTLDFFYQVDNTNTSNGTDNLRLATMLNFTGFNTAVAYVTSSGSVAPSDAYRGSLGDTMNFDFLTAGGANTLGSMAPYGQGNVSYWMEIDTNATSFCTTCGSLSAQDSGNAAMLAPAPIATPEPASLALLGGGLALLGVTRLRRTKKA